jgi:hypothetical protein
MSSIDNLSEEDYRCLVNTLSSLPRWQWDTSFTSTQLCDVGSIAVDRVAEGRFQHSETCGVLYFLMPDLGDPPKSMRCLLEQPFDPSIPSDSEFLNDVSIATDRLVPEHQNPYISAGKDPNTVLCISVPVDYALSQVGDAGRIAADVSEGVADIYQEVYNSLGR